MKELERAHGVTDDLIAATDDTIGATGQARGRTSQGCRPPDARAPPPNRASSSTDSSTGATERRCRPTTAPHVATEQGSSPTDGATALTSWSVAVTMRKGAPTEWTNRLPIERCGGLTNRVGRPTSAISVLV
jgi:hypothetical protein